MLKFQYFIVKKDTKGQDTGSNIIKRSLSLHQVNNTFICIETLLQGNKLTGIHLEGNLIKGSRIQLFFFYSLQFIRLFDCKQQGLELSYLERTHCKPCQI